MEPVTQCNLCGSRRQRTLFEGRDRLHGEPGCFNVVECQDCGLLYLNPRPSPDELDRYYPAGYISYPTAIQDEKSAIRRWDRQYGLHKRCSQVIRRVGGPGRVLDVGCATGIFLDGMRQRGWDAYGVEPSAHAVQYARSRLGLNVTEGFLEDAGFQDAFFDVVTMWDVLEHVPDPRATLAEIARILKPGGWLVLNLPNPESWERRWFGPYWAGWDVPRHFHLFDRQALRRYLEEAGLRLEEVASFTGRHGVLVLDLEFRMTDWRASPQTRRRLLKLASSLPARLLTWPFFNLADRLNKSSAMAVFARKPAHD